MGRINILIKIIGNIEKYIEQNKFKIGIFTGMIAFSLIICFNFLIPHFPSDAYYISAYGYETYINHYLASNRIFCALLFKIYMALNISITQQMHIMGCILTIIMGISWYYLYSYVIKLIKKEKEIFYNIIVICASFLIVFNICTAEGLLFVEDGTMPLGVFVSILGACIIATERKGKYFISLLLVTIAGLLYQGSSSVFVLLGLVLESIKNKNNKKIIFKETVIIGLIYGVAMIFNFIGVKAWSNILNYPFRQFDFPSISIIIDTILKFGKFILVDNCGIGPKYWYLMMILILSVVFFINLLKKKIEYFEILEFFTLVFLSIIIPIIPVIVTPIEQQYLEPRMAMCFGGIIGILVIFLLPKIISKSIFLCLVLIISVINVVVNSIFFVYESSTTLKINKIEEIMAKQIINEIQEYEEKTKIEVKGIGTAFDNSYSQYYKGEPEFRCFNSRSLGIDWAVKEVLTTYSGKKYINVTTPQNIKDNFLNKNWDFYSKEQLVFEGENLYICIF